MWKSVSDFHQNLILPQPIRWLLWVESENEVEQGRKTAEGPRKRKHGARAFHLQWMLVARDRATTKLLLPSSAAVVVLEGILPGPSFHGLVIAGATDRRVLLLPRREDCRTDPRLRVPAA